MIRVPTRSTAEYDAIITPVARAKATAGSPDPRPAAGRDRHGRWSDSSPIRSRSDPVEPTARAAHRGRPTPTATASSGAVPRASG